MAGYLYSFRALFVLYLVQLDNKEVAILIVQDSRKNEND